MDERELKIFKCPDCIYEGRNNESLRVHKSRHHDDKIKCDMCNKWLPKPSLRKHLLAHIIGNKKEVDCKLCYKSLIILHP